MTQIPDHGVAVTGFIGKEGREELVEVAVVKGNMGHSTVCRASKLFLTVSDCGYRAKKLYTSRGYREMGVIPDFHKPGIAVYIMMKSL
jgi:ribosomal protein S18 acetylase RimI-like enzyme